MSTFPKTVPWWFTERIIRSHMERAAPLLHGRVLDLGCGKKRYRDMFDVDSYLGLDVTTDSACDVVADCRDLPFRDASFDGVLSTQVLEHVDDLDRLFAEVRRVLRPGGAFVFTAPLVARVHCAPHDYWRFSEFGLRYLLERHDFRVQAVEPMGGFLTTQCCLWSFYVWEKLNAGPRHRHLAALLSKGIFRLLNPVFGLVHRLDRDTTTPFNYIAVGIKAGP